MDDPDEREQKMTDMKVVVLVFPAIVGLSVAHDHDQRSAFPHMDGGFLCHPTDPLNKLLRKSAFSPLIIAPLLHSAQSNRYLTRWQF